MSPLLPAPGTRAALAALLALSIAAGCKRSSEKKAEASAGAAEAGGLYAVFETSRGVIGAKLLPGEAPKAVASFVELATGKKPFKDPLTKGTRTASFYDGLLFHVAEPGRWIQSGDPASRDAPLGADNAAGYNFGWTDPGFKLEDELPQLGTKVYDRPCMVGLSNHGPHTSNSQFFITEVPAPQLDPQACNRSPSGVCGFVRIAEGVCGCEHVGAIARAGRSQTRLVKVTISDTPPTCK